MKLKRIVLMIMMTGAIATGVAEAGPIAQAAQSVQAPQTAKPPQSSQVVQPTQIEQQATAAQLAQAVQAPDRTVYVNVGGGFDFPTKSTSSILRSQGILYSPTPAGGGVFYLPGVDWRSSYQRGYEGNLAIGSVITKRLRMDVEFLYQNIKRKVTGNYGWQQLLTTGGDIYATTTGNFPESTIRAKVYSLLANGYIDYRNPSKFTPFIGAGIGAAWINTPRSIAGGTLVITDATAGTTTTVGTVGNGPALSGAAFAWQFKAGASYDINKCTAFVLQYRFFGTSEFHASNSSIIVGNGNFPIGNQNTSMLRNSMIDLNLRYFFM